MRISWSWLRELVDPGLAPDEVARRLTMAGLEVEGIERLGEAFSGVVVAEVLASRKHPKADKLTLVTVTDGTGPTEVVCGAPNVPAAGARVLWARPGAKLPDGRTIETRAVHGTPSPGMLCSEVELGIGEDASGIIVLAGEDAAAAPGLEAQQALELRDVVFEIGVTPNRGDCLGHLGVAREVAALTGAPLRRPDASLERFLADGDVTKLVRVDVEDPAGCPRYTARLIEGLTVAPSPRWMRRRLEAVGVRPISNLVDVTNYVMFELGQPLHAFDRRRVHEDHIVVRRARPGERMTTLDDVERALEPRDLLICDPRGPVALAGVMGGAGSQVASTTTSVLLESASFDPTSVRRTARRLALPSESSHRFERGVDPELADVASARAAHLFCQLGGGRVLRGVVDAYPRRAVPVTLALRPSRVALVLGVEVPVAEITERLRRLELRVEGAGDELRVTCPTFRPDLEREIDLIEEVARVGGLDAIPSRLPQNAVAPTGWGDRLSDAVRDALRAAGLDEAALFAFTSPERVASLRLPVDHPASRPMPLVNPLREEQSVLRTSLLCNLLGALSRNLTFGLRDVRLFEVGAVFLAGGRALPDEPRHAAAVLCGERVGWLKSDGPLDFFDVKGIVERLLAALRVPDVRFVTAGDEAAYLHPGARAAILRADGDREVLLGAVGEVHPETRERHGIDRPVFAFEIDLEQLPPMTPAQMRALPRYPSVVRDVSFFVDAAVPAARVRELIDAAREPLVEELRVLEDYREAGRVPAGKKGMLWSMTYRAADRTLTDAEVDRAHEQLVKRLLSDLGAERR